CGGGTCRGESGADLASAGWREAVLAAELLGQPSRPELGHFLAGLITAAAPGTAQACHPHLRAILARTAAQVLPGTGQPLGSGAGLAAAGSAGWRIASQAGTRLG